MRMGRGKAEYEIGGPGDMDAFSGGELVVMSGSLVMVLALVVVAGLVIVGTIAL
jgi:flagellar biogenesis protein FliO